MLEPTQQQRNNNELQPHLKPLWVAFVFCWIEKAVTVLIPAIPQLLSPTCAPCASNTLTRTMVRCQMESNKVRIPRHRKMGR